MTPRTREYMHSGRQGQGGTNTCCRFFPKEKTAFSVVSALFSKALFHLGH